MGRRLFVQGRAYLAALAAGSFVGLLLSAYLGPLPASGLRLPFGEVLVGTFAAVAAGCLPFLVPFLLFRWIGTIFGSTGAIGSAIIWTVAALISIYAFNALIRNALNLERDSLLWITIGSIVAGLVYHRLGGFAPPPSGPEASA